MAKRLIPETITAVALCPLGANLDEETNDGAHVTLFKAQTPPHATTTPAADTTANSTGVAFVAKARQMYPGEPIDRAIERLAADRPDEYRHATQQTGHGTTKAYAAAAPTVAPIVKRADATARLMKMADVLAQSGAVTRAESYELAAVLAPELYAAHAGQPMIRKSGKPTEAQLERQIVEWFLTARNAMRGEADRRAAETTAVQMRGAITELLNLWSAE